MVAVHSGLAVAWSATELCFVVHTFAGGCMRTAIVDLYERRVSGLHGFRALCWMAGGPVDQKGTFVLTGVDRTHITSLTVTTSVTWDETASLLQARVTGTAQNRHLGPPGVPDSDIAAVAQLGARGALWWHKRSVPHLETPFEYTVFAPAVPGTAHAAHSQRGFVFHSEKTAAVWSPGDAAVKLRSADGPDPPWVVAWYTAVDGPHAGSLLAISDPVRSDPDHCVFQRDLPDEGAVRDVAITRTGTLVVLTDTHIVTTLVHLHEVRRVARTATPLIGPPATAAEHIAVDADEDQLAVWTDEWTACVPFPRANGGQGLGATRLVRHGSDFSSPAEAGCFLGKSLLVVSDEPSKLVDGVAQWPIGEELAESALALLLCMHRHQMPLPPEVTRELIMASYTNIQ
jgi:hypothetical protein